MAKKVILSQNGETIYPTTILGAIIDPNTGSPVNINQGGSSSEIIYTINGAYADESGNFTLTNTMLNAAHESHTHSISNITNLQESLDLKSNVDHTHVMVSGITIGDGGPTLSGNIKLAVRENGNVFLDQNDNTITIHITPHTADLAENIQDSNDNTQFKIFVGTQAEWDAFKSSVELTESNINEFIGKQYQISNSANGTFTIATITFEDVGKFVRTVNQMIDGIRYLVFIRS